MMRDFGKLMREAQRIQAEITRIQKELSETRVEGSAGGSAVKVVLSGTMEPLEVKISPEVLENSDVSLLEDLVLSAIREAINSSKELAQEKMSQVAGGLGLPGMPGGFF